jgi:putative flavoprotein involved in K+ transport
VIAERVQVAVVGAGQAGLAVSRELADLGVEPVVLERGRVAQTWRDRWDSFRLVTPNWCTQLPGGAYEGPAPDAFMLRDELVAYLESYADDSGVPVREASTSTRSTRRAMVSRCARRRETSEQRPW